MRILITGVSGMLGNNLALAFSESNEVCGTYLSHPVCIPGTRTFGLDLTDYAAVRRLLLHLQPDAIIHCASRTAVDAMETDREGGWEANVLTSRNIMDAMRDQSGKLVLVSTDSVYPGTGGPAGEDTPPAPKNWYGHTKLMAEDVFRQRSGALILRTNLYGWNIQPKKGLGEWFLNHLLTGTPARGFSDAWFNPTYTFDFARHLDLALKRGLTGTYNCASRDSTTKFEFGKLMARIFGLDEKLVTPHSLAEADLPAPRGLDMRLDVHALEQALGSTLPTVEEGLRAFHKHHVQGLPKAITAPPRVPPGTWYPATANLPYGRQSIDDADIAAVVRVLRAPFITQGPEAKAFELELASMVGAKHAVSTNSATSALHLACLCSGLESGDEAITSPITFLASANCIAYCGATPVFADIDPQTYNLAPEDLERAISPRTRAVIPVHFAGQSCDMAAIRAVVDAKQRQYGHKIFIIEDASHALGSKYQGDPVGCCRYSDMAVFSFHPVKHITTGEGGMLATNDGAMAEQAFLLRNHGMIRPSAQADIDRAPWFYEQTALGYNYRITDIQCALGRTQLAKLPLFMDRRRALVGRYNTLLAAIPHATLPHESASCRSNFHLYVLKLDYRALGNTRAKVMKHLQEAGIYTQVHYIPVHLQPYYAQKYGTKPGTFPKAEAYYEDCLSLPLFPLMQDTDIDHVVRTLRQALEQ